MDRFEWFVYDLMRDEQTIALFREIDEINNRNPETESADAFVERVWLENENRYLNPALLKANLGGGGPPTRPSN